MTYRSSNGRWHSAIPRIKTEKKKERSPKKPKHVACHVFAETTHVEAAPHGFACVVIPAT